VVDEFPNLQGIMGYYYAKAEKLSDEVATALRDHYKPQGPSDACPKGVAATLALADKIDSLCGLMLAGEKPSGSKDPFSLRRQALGIVRIILENEINIDLVELIKFSIGEYANSSNPERGEESQIVIEQIIAFLEERFRYFLKDQYNAELISAVLDMSHEPDLLETKSKLSAVDKFLHSADGDDLLNAYKRASNILGTEKISEKINEELFVSAEEAELFKSVVNCQVKVELAIIAKKYSKALQALAALRIPLTNFFDKVMVKDNDPAIAQNRMALLMKMRLYLT